MPDRLAAAFLILASTLAGHAAAYAVAGGHTHAVGHGYLAALTAVAVPLGFGALVWHACQGAARRWHPSLGHLLVAQPLLFLAQEGLEHALTGHGIASLAHSPTLAVGLAAQALAAATSLLLLRGARATGRAAAALLRPRPSVAARRPPVPRPRPSTPLHSRLSGHRVRERAPPSLPAPA